MLICISLFLNLISFSYLIKRLYYKYYWKVKGADDDKLKIGYWLNRHELFERLAIDSNSIVFLGDSLTQNFELIEIFRDINIKNRGINGDTLSGILHRLNPILLNVPQKIFIQIGINDLAKGEQVEDLFIKYVDLIVTIQRTSKSVQLYVQSILPVQNEGKSLAAYCNRTINQKIRALNEELKKICSSFKVSFVDLYKDFELEGELNPRYSVDGVHLSGEGYLLWSKILGPYLK